jgi:hypothetical protein
VRPNLSMNGDSLADLSQGSKGSHAHQVSPMHARQLLSLIGSDTQISQDIFQLLDRRQIDVRHSKRENSLCEVSESNMQLPNCSKASLCYSVKTFMWYSGNDHSFSKSLSTSNIGFASQSAEFETLQSIFFRHSPMLSLSKNVNHMICF